MRARTHCTLDANNLLYPTFKEKNKTHTQTEMGGESVSVCSVSPYLDRVHGVAGRPVHRDLPHDEHHHLRTLVVREVTAEEPCTHTHSFKELSKFCFSC